MVVGGAGAEETRGFGEAAYVRRRDGEGAAS